ncbi:MAG: hypothetical protein DWQ44_00415 [Bacteroidetes bacterium]|nr:MAG: hypothetical protein DWQ33_03790 [Bacteroidota bacterium]REK07591.1 MAG: hypothetical protein DWQ39_01480 [Bacteroidota bacterium]REK36977.1 MAG: hypothetical protein DWQ44_00415 [Bacteroidota bacterium]REK47797.1 MAG: hypothetical protein DWQ48_11475 [Bacteroidota bacterium]
MMRAKKSTIADLKKELLSDYSVLNNKRVCKLISGNKTLFPALVRMLSDNDTKLVKRAAWVFGTLVKEYPEMMQPQLDLLLHLISQGGHVSVRRNVLRGLQFISIPEKYIVRVIDICFDFLNQHEEPPAVKAFSVTVLSNISCEYPEVKNELRAWFDRQAEGSSKAVIKRMEKAGLI